MKTQIVQPVQKNNFRKKADSAKAQKWLSQKRQPLFLIQDRTIHDNTQNHRDHRAAKARPRKRECARQPGYRVYNRRHDKALPRTREYARNKAATGGASARDSFKISANFKRVFGSGDTPSRVWERRHAAGSPLI
ncbi:MAG: hypothetical protein ACI4T6_01305, partial [Candidatus Flemingiibacterium sp.]